MAKEIVAERPYTSEEVFPVEIVDIDSLQPHPRNYKVHPESQIAHIIQSIEEHGLYRPIVTAQDGTILAGHGVVLAAKRLGLKRIPIRRLPLPRDDARAMKLLAGDNEISHLGEVDDLALSAILSQIKAEAPTGLLGTGYDDESLAKLLEGLSLPGGELASNTEPDTQEAQKTQYTSRVTVPTYTPNGDKPALADLVDLAKTERLLEKIANIEGISEDERVFLTIAAQRHNVFHYNKIADYYAHSSEIVQDLMEESALVIVDFQRAIELGYVQMTQRMAEMVGEEYPDDEE